MTSGKAASRPATPAPPRHVERLIVHQLDIAHPVPGGIDGVIRGILRFAPTSDVVAVVGVLASPGPGRKVGRWERHDVDGREIWFLPVARLDAADQRRVVPHSVRLAAGLARHRRRLPATESVHAHRADVAWAVRTALPRTPLTYFVHTQEHGLTTGATDSFWRRAPGVHAAMERAVVRGARDVVVFNPEYARLLAERSPHVVFSPNWYEPDLIRFRSRATDPWRIVWLGRLERPKDPALAVAAFAALAAREPEHPWSLVVVGSGTLEEDVAREVGALPAELRVRVELTGALPPQQVGEVLGASGVFLMTSVPGYEGHPRVLVEALASGLPAVVTTGSDTGDLVHDDDNGFTVGRDPEEIASALSRARVLPRERARESVEHLSAPTLVARVLRGAGVDGT